MRKVIKVILVAVLMMHTFALLVGGSFAADFCVSSAAELQDALTTAASNGEADVIMVQQGIYPGNFTYNSAEGYSITLLGGYSRGCSSRVVDPSSTMLDGSGSGRVFDLYDDNGGDIIVDGFTIRNGDTAGRGAGIYAKSYSSSDASGDIIIRNNLITGNISEDDGGGIWANSISSWGTAGSIILMDNTIRENAAAIIGSGVYAWSYSTYNTSGNVILRNNTIIDNRVSWRAGGLYAEANGQSESGDVILTNNIIAGNETLQEGGGVYASAGSLSGLIFTNNTITGNTAYHGGGIYLTTFDSIIYVFNNIIWGNTASVGSDIRISGSLNAAYGYNNDYSGMDGSWDISGGNIDVDPLFEDPAAGDYHLQALSPCIDAGTNGAPELPTVDFEGDPRMIDGDENGSTITDMGADEYVKIGLAWIASAVGGPDRSGAYRVNGNIAIKNRGTERVPKGELRVYVSDDENLDPGDARISKVPVAAMNPGGKTMKKFLGKGNFPTYLPVLYLIAGFEAEGESAIPKPEVLEAGVDLTGEWDSLTKSVAARSGKVKVRGKCWVINRGFLPSGGFEVQVFHSDNPAGGPDDRPMLRRPKRVKKLLPGKNQMVRFSYVFDKDPGGFCIIKVDQWLDVLETDEGNNHIAEPLP